ncbi:MAG: energy transducer TonB [bacterium]|nr:MAG: energy transducer TonB [bacterium]
MMMLREKSSRVAVIISILLHIIFLLLFFLIKLNFLPEFPEFTEITFVSGNNKLFATPIPIEAALIPTTMEDQQKQTSEIVKLPIRKMLEDEQPQLKVVDQGKQIPEEDIQTILEIEHANNRKDLAESLLKTPANDEKELANPVESISLDDKLLPSTSKATESSGQTPYHIEGQAASRTVVHRVIPEYPENLQKQAIVKINFTVLSNGHIGELIPVIKSDALLEKITLDALRQWRFNPLPDDAPQRVERGVITFRYLLK